MTHKLCRCGRIVKDRCEVCQPRINHEQSAAKRGYDYQWKKLSERIRKNNPLCFDCEQNGIVTPATEVHHIVKIKDAPQLRYSQENLVQLCKACHDRRHANE